MASTCERCKRDPGYSGDENALRTIVPLCQDCEAVVMQTQLPEIREAILAVLK